MTTIDEYVEIDKRIDVAEQKGYRESSRERWEFGKKMLAERVQGGRGRGSGPKLPEGRLAELTKRTGKSQRELGYRMEFAEACPTEAEYCTAVQKYTSWKDLRQSFTKSHGAQHRPKPIAPKADDPRLADAINQMEDGGKDYTSKQVVEIVKAQGLTVSEDTVDRKRNVIVAQREAEVDAMNIDWDSVPATVKVKLEAMRRKMIKMYELEFEPRVQAAVQVRLASAQEYMDRMRKEYRQVLDARRGVFTKAEHTLIRKCLHSDKRLAITVQELDEAFRIFNEKDIVLLKESDRPTTTLPTSTANLRRRTKR